MNIGLITIPCLFLLIFAIWQSFQPTQARLYWIACVALIIIGIIGAIFIPDYLSTYPQMPRIVELAVWMILVGLCGTVTGIFVIIFHRFFRK